ncbi:MAG: hypothetical protein RR349_04040 [Oscillospiraceae bacterium]
MKKRKNLLKLIIFPLLLLVLFSPILLCGELLHADLVAAIQPVFGDKFIYGMAYTNNTAHYKLKLINKRKADIITIGNSRVLQFNDYFFTDKTGFYNGGSIAASLPACLDALQAIEQSALPKIVILGLDASFFNETYTAANHYANKAEFLNPYDYKTFNLLYESLETDYKKGKFKVRQLLLPPWRIGVNAKVNGNGYEQDGSYTYQREYNSAQSTKERIQPFLTDIANGSGRFSGGNDLYSVSIDKLREIIGFCKANNIHLIAFTPPYANAAMDILNSRTDIDYIDKIDAAVRPMLENEGFEFYNYTSPYALGMTDDYFIDAFHGSDCAYLLMTIDMLQNGSRLNEYASLSELLKMYDNRLSDLEIKR